MMSTATSTAADAPAIPIFATVREYREWRQKAFDEKKSVGFVPTMGALHDGHLSLVKRSLAENDLTVLSIFVNPAQFAPHEDLATYPRTLPHDLKLLSALSHPVPNSSRPRVPSAVFVPSVPEMYPSGISQDVGNQTGTFVEVKGYGEQMEGQSRPTFFRGVATVVAKLFNIIQPTNAYFGQKDIQQALLLRRLVTDLHMSYPSPSRLHIVPTARDPTIGLALSSRNAYLTPAEREKAPALYAALQAGARAWGAGESKADCVQRAIEVFSRAGASDTSSLLPGDEQGDARATEEKVTMKVDYIEFNDSSSFSVLPEDESQTKRGTSPVILSGAVWIGRTRLIDNLILGDARGALME